VPGRLSQTPVGILYLTFGTKVERNSYTGLEAQPTVRALWLPDQKRSVWAAVSRAVRTVNRSDRGFRTDVAAFPMGESVGVVSLLGHADSGSESVMAYELGKK
jgi:iron complex outermembrane receptor protein